MAREKEEGVEQTPQAEVEKQFLETLSAATKQTGGLPVTIKGQGKWCLHGGTFSGIVVGAVWAYFTHNGCKFRTDSKADKEKILAGDTTDIVLVPIGQTAQAVVEVEKAPSRGFVPRSKRFAPGTSIQMI